MILILSKNVMEVSTERVMDWITSLNGKCVRLNGEEMISDTAITFTVTNETESIKIDTVDGEVYSSDVNVVWFRRTINDLSHYLDYVQNTELQHQINAHIQKEFLSFYEVFHWHFRNAAWLNDLKTSGINKINALQNAKASGLVIPDTFVINSKAQLLAVMDKRKNYITKPVGNGTFFNNGNAIYPIYTERFNESDVEALNDQLFPSLVQEYIEKDFELRVFYLDNKCYSMAIFSQQDIQTQTDFRRYNMAKPNRCIPYKLPMAIEKCIIQFMRRSNLNCGSLDLIKSKTGDYVFLEVNPVGQFAMVSYPCNYYLEEKIASHLTKLDKSMSVKGHTTI